MVEIIASNSQASVPQWSEEQVFTDADEFFLALSGRIAAAKRSVDVEMYIFTYDVLGKKMVELLGQAKSRGVKVRVIVDGVGSLGYIRTLGAEFERVGVSFRVFRGLPWKWRKTKKRRVEHLQQIKLFLERINGRNHRKMILIDRHEAWVGSMNIWANHLASVNGERAWRETGIVVGGSGVGQLCRSFELIWRTRGWYTPRRRKKRSLSTQLVWISNSRRVAKRKHRELMKRFRAAKSQIWITTAYFVPDGVLVRALRRAAANGVDVRILVPRQSDVVFIPWLAQAYYQGLLRAGAKVYEYLPRVLHAKTLIVDDYALVGTSNLNYRSLLHDLEVDVVVTRKSERQKLLDDFIANLNCSEAVTVESMKGFPRWKRTIGSLMFLFRYWL